MQLAELRGGRSWLDSRFRAAPGRAASLLEEDQHGLLVELVFGLTHSPL